MIMMMTNLDEAEADDGPGEGEAADQLPLDAAVVVPPPVGAKVEHPPQEEVLGRGFPEVGIQIEPSTKKSAKPSNFNVYHLI